MKFLRKIFKSSSNDKPKDKDMDTLAMMSQMDYMIETEYNKLKKDGTYNDFEMLVLLLYITYKHMSPIGTSDKTKELLISLYDDINSKMTKISRNTKTYVIFDYAKFLIFARDMLLFTNDKENLIYIQEYNDSSIKIIFTFDSYKVGYAFTKNFADNKSSGGLLDEFENVPKDDYICFVEVKRDDESKTDFTYSLSYGDYHTFDIKLDLLFNSILNNTLRYIRESYEQILNNTFQVYTGINNNDNIGWKDICENGLRISTGKKE